MKIRTYIRIQCVLSSVVVALFVAALITAAPPQANAAYEDDLVGYWAMDGNWNDTSGYGATPTTYGDPDPNASGYMGSAGYFDGNDWVAYGNPSQLDMDNRLTMSVWIKSSASNDTWPRIMGQARRAYNEGYSIVGKESDGKFGASVCFDDGTVRDAWTPSGGFNDNQWHNVTGIYDGNKVSIYVDGQYQNGYVVGPKHIENSSSTTFDLGAGHDGNLRWYYTGSLDDAAVLSRALDSYEIKAVYDVGISAYQHILTGINDTLGLGYATWQLGDLAEVYDTAAPATVDGLQWSKAAGLDAGRAVGETWESGGKYYTKLDSAGNGIESDGLADFNDSLHDSALKAHWNLDGNMRDQVAAANNLMTYNITTGFQSGQIGQALYFDGVDDVAEMRTPQDLGITNQLTLSAWINGASAQTSQWARIISQFEWQNDEGFALLRLNETQRIAFNFYDTTGTERTLQSTVNVLDDAWHHVVATFSGDTMYLYVDGELDASVYLGAKYIQTSNSSLQLGGNADHVLYRYYKGYIDDVGIWDRYLDEYEAGMVFDLGVEKYAAMYHGLNELLALGYDTSELAQIAEVYLNQSGEVIIDGVRWTYTDDPFDGRVMGEAWEADGVYYVKINGGVQGEEEGDGKSVPELPFGAMQMMILGLSGVLARLRKR